MIDTTYFERLVEMGHKHRDVPAIAEITLSFAVDVDNLKHGKPILSRGAGWLFAFRRTVQTLEFALEIAGEDISALKRPTTPGSESDLQEKYDALREAALRMQSSVGNMLGNGARDSKLWFETIAEAQQYLSSHTNATRSESEAVRQKFNIPDAVID